MHLIMPGSLSRLVRQCLLISLVLGTETAIAQPSLACCNCSGEQVTLDLSTGQGGAVDAIWTVNNGAAYTTPPVTGSLNWMIIPPALWLQPVASPTPSSAVPAGVFRYRARFNVADCAIGRTVRLDGLLAADNSVKAYLDNNLIASCTVADCFSTTGGNAPIAFAVASVTAGVHILQVDVTNNLSSLGSMTASGLSVTAALSAQCAMCNNCPYLGSFDGANCYVGHPPPGTSAFIFANNFYYTPVGGNQCPQPGSWFDGANCFVMTIPAQATPFIWGNAWHVQTNCPRPSLGNPGRR